MFTGSDDWLPSPNPGLPGDSVAIAPRALAYRHLTHGGFPLPAWVPGSYTYATPSCVQLCSCGPCRCMICVADVGPCPFDTAVGEELAPAAEEGATAEAVGGRADSPAGGTPAALRAAHRCWQGCCSQC